ncbi:MAG: ABC transporter permease [Phycisphaerales bacterium]|nr:MAG: ABC transporter permease [Phycisphaerales bacterium]
MILTQTTAIFLDAYRELNAKKLFWITMLLSGLVVAFFALLGINERGVSIATYTMEIPGVNTSFVSQEGFYKTLFSSFGVGIWLTWIATILGLVSTAPLIPDFVASGSVELTLSKPISRARIFLTKLLTGLLFMALQVSVFTGASFLVIGLRAGVWELGLFWAIPIVVAFFSYLYCVCALVGLLTRSTIAALLVTILFWFFLFLLNAGDGALLAIKTQAEVEAERGSARVERMVQGTSRELVALRRSQLPEDERETAEIPEPTLEEIEAGNLRITQTREEVARNERLARSLAPWHRGVLIAKTALPKTSETTEFLNRVLISQAELDQAMDNQAKAIQERMSERDTGAEAEAQRRTQQAVRDRSTFWVLGTSLTFVFVVTAFATWRFTRRDF